LLQSSLASAFLDFHSLEVRGILERFFQTRTGAAFARSVLGEEVTRFNPAGRNEVIHTLMNPANQELAETFELRLNKLSRALKMQGVLTDLPTEIVEREAARFFELARPTGGPRAGKVAFADGETTALVTAEEARRAEFIMGMGMGKGASEQVAPALSAAARDLPAPPRGFRHDAFEQLLQWEEQAGLRYYRETTQFFGLSMAPAPAAEVQIQAASFLPAGVRDLFVRDNRVFWPQHPFNTQRTPFSDIAPTENWPARLTSSRSLVIWNKRTGQAFSLKAPTDYPHRTQQQLAKTHLQEDIKSGVYRSEYLAKVDRAIGADPHLGVLPEIFSAAEIRGGNGFVVRDLSALQDGHYYLPALSIPFVGHRIAQLNGQAFDTFWEASYARLLGRSKAKLMIRYGLQMETPNCQNMLIQFDRKMRPTGKLFFRDISDSQPVRGVAQAIGQSQMLETDAKLGFQIDDHLDPNTKNSFWRLDEDPLLPVAKDTLTAWKHAHDEAYVEEALRLLDVKPKDVRTIGELDGFLATKSGQVALGRFHQK
jgi:hypothetical protein